MKKFTYILLLVASTLLLHTLSASALTVGPVKLEYLAERGSSVSGTIVLQNEEDMPRTLTPSFEAFTEEGGQKVFMKEESDLSSWIKTATSVSLLSKEEKRIPFTIEIPRDASPGSHFAVMWWGTAPEEGSQKQVSIITRAGVLIYLTVKGDLREAGTIREFNTGDKSVFWDMPIPLSLSFSNEGNVYLKPKGSITISSIWGSRKKMLVFNEYGSQVLPGKTKTFTFAINEDDGFYFGPYKATLEVAYGMEKTQANGSFWFWIFPIGWIIKFVILLLFVFVAVPALVRRYNRWIIKKSQNAPQPLQK